MASSSNAKGRQTYASLLTPAGRGAVATVAIDGPDALEMVAHCFKPLSGRPLTAYQPGDVVVGLFQSARGSGEELVVGLIAADRVEVHCHGGRAAVEAVLQSLTQQGCVAGDWQQFVADRSEDALEAEGWIALAAATTERTAGLLLDQIRGALRREIESVLDFIAKGAFPAAIERVATLIERGRVGLHLTQPWRVVIAGPPNVGKSSLINALAGYERAIVFDQPGTTRDVLSARTALHGWPVELIDTAGLRKSDDPLEAAGISKAQGTLATADLVLAVFEAHREWTSASEALLPEIGTAAHLTIYNKLDLGDVDFGDGRPPGVAVSAQTRKGLETLTDTIVARLIPQPLEIGSGIPFTRRQLTALEAASHALSKHDSIGAAAELSRLLKAEASRSAV